MASSRLGDYIDYMSVRTDFVYEGRDRQKAISPMSDEAAAMPRESSAREPVFGEMAAEWRIAAEWSVPTAPPGARTIRRNTM